MIKDITIPDISENVTSGTVVEVLVQPGDDVQVDDTVIEFETDKAVVEIPSPYQGRITEVLVEEGDELNIGDTIAKIETDKAASAEEKQDSKEQEKKEVAEGAEEEEKVEEKKTEDETTAAEAADKEPETEEEGTPEKDRRTEVPQEEHRKAEPAGKTEAKPSREEPDRKRRGPAPASPSVRRFARQMGIDIHEVEARGDGDRISEADVKAHVKNMLASEAGRQTKAAPSGTGRQHELPDFSRWGEIETRELTGVRRLTAESMATAWQTVAHVTQFERVDITDAMAFTRRHGDRVAEQGGKLTITAVLMNVCAAALKRFPDFNASIDPQNNRLIVKKYVHIGLAVDTPRGLLVPVVRNADRKTITELAVEIVDLARKARSKKITPDEMEGGTFTISNQGGIGGTEFTPVVFWPQAAILGVGRATTEPVYIDGQFQPRSVLPLALSYDHRIVDGADAARFVDWIRQSIEQPLTLHLD